MWSDIGTHGCQSSGNFTLWKIEPMKVSESNLGYIPSYPCSSLSVQSSFPLQIGEFRATLTNPLCSCPVPDEMFEAWRKVEIVQDAHTLKLVASTTLRPPGPTLLTAIWPTRAMCWAWGSSRATMPCHMTRKTNEGIQNLIRSKISWLLLLKTKAFDQECC